MLKLGSLQQQEFLSEARSGEHGDWLEDMTEVIAEPVLSQEDVQFLESALHNKLQQEMSGFSIYDDPEASAKRIMEYILSV